MKTQATRLPAFANALDRWARSVIWNTATANRAARLRPDYTLKQEEK